MTPAAVTRRRPPADPPPDAACGTCGVAITAGDSPDRTDQLADFDRAHPEPGHRRVSRLAANRSDVTWGANGV